MNGQKPRSRAKNNKSGDRQKIVTGRLTDAVMATVS